MSGYLHTFVFGYYPYLCAIVFLLGSLVRFEREQYTWRSGSSQLLRKRQLFWGSNLFHIGILLLFVGHFAGLLTPKSVYEGLGMTSEQKQVLAIVAGGIFGVICFIGLTLLLHRRLFDARIRRTSSAGDIFILLLLWVQLVIGMTTLPLSWAHRKGGEVMIKLSNWAQDIVFFRAGAADHIVDVHWDYKLHIFLGVTLFLVFPFTRLVHVWSAPIWFIGRKGFQIVRTRKAAGR